MNPHDNFERANAKEWDEQSSVSFVPGPGPLSRFERVNAREWDEESTVSFAPSANERAAPDDEPALLIDFDELPRLPAPAQGQQFVAARSGNHTRVNLAKGIGRPGPALTRKTPSQIPAAGYLNRQHHGTGYHESSGDSSSASTEILTGGGSRKQRDGTTTGRENRHIHGARSNTSRQTSTKVAWAGSAKLVTTRRAKDLELKALKEADKNKYLRGPIEKEVILSYGYYIWPHEEGSVIDVLGQELQYLNPIRIDHRVYIEWIRGPGTQDLLKISSEYPHSENHITPAIKGIRLAIENAKARAVLATPKYFVVPPTASAMRAVVAPKKVTTKTEMVDGMEKTKNITCIGTQLVGKKFSRKEKEKWRKRRVLDHDNYVAEFKCRLSSSLIQLAALKGWMRMRVHFGHLVLRKFPSEYAASQNPFEQFIQMIGNSHLRGEIEQMIPAIVAMKLRKKIVEWPERFRPAHGRTFSLEDVNFKDTEIIYVTTLKGDEYRVEADIDVTYDEDGSVRHQTGSYDVFRDDQSNKRVVLSVVDPERQVDFTLQVITDGKVVIPETVRDFDKLIEGSVPVNTRVRQDNLGLLYPEVHPQCRTGFRIQKVVVRSVIQYALTNSGYFVEIAIYRTWHHSTRSEPETSASVSMFHPQWDLDMDSIENTTNERIWDRGLHTFFDNGIDQDSNGFENFLAEVKTIQGFLCDAANEAQKEAAAEEAAQENTREATQEIEQIPASSPIQSLLDA